MNVHDVEHILQSTDYVRLGGSAEELRCAVYLRERCADMGLDARIESFPLRMYERATDALTVDGEVIACTSYGGVASAEVTAPLYYMEDTSPASLKRCRGTVVLLDRRIGYKTYDLLLSHGAKGFITCGGSLNDRDRRVDAHDLCFTTEGEGIPGIHIHIADGVRLVRRQAREATLCVKQISDTGESHNVVLDLAGECEETVLVCAHYDSTSLSHGAYDNMSACIVLLYLAEYFSKTPHRRRIRLLWCGSEEKGLLGSRAYCDAHADELKDVVLNVNLDMLGSVLGSFVMFSCANTALTDYLERFVKERDIPATARYGIRSSDSNSFVQKGVPAVSFARYAPGGLPPIHSPHDTMELVDARRLLRDAEWIAQFVNEVADLVPLPFPREISEKIRTDVEEYFQRK